MGKAVLVMEIPERCRDCKWLEHVLKFCGISEEFMEDISIRQDWCPLRPLPERMEVCGKYPELVPLYRIRWNECLDKITEN